MERVILIKKEVNNVDEMEEELKKKKKNLKDMEIVINKEGILEDSRWEKEIEIKVNDVVRGKLIGIK